jgi:hypothetical protein
MPGEALLCPLPFSWCQLLMAQTVERTAYGQNAEGTLGVGTVTGQCSGVQHHSFKPPAALSKPRFLSHFKTLVVQQHSVEFDLADARTTKSSLILYPKPSQPMRQSGLMGALRTVLHSVDAEN